MKHESDTRECDVLMRLCKHTTKGIKFKFLFYHQRFLLLPRLDYTCDNLPSFKAFFLTFFSALLHHFFTRTSKMRELSRNEWKMLTVFNLAQLEWFMCQNIVSSFGSLAFKSLLNFHFFVVDCVRFK